MAAFLHYLALSAPLFGLVIVGLGLARLPFWKPHWTRRGSKLVFAVPLPVLMFHMMSHRSTAAPVDARLLLAFFGGCFIVFGIGRAVGRYGFGLDGVSQSVFALGGVFSNNVLLGLPLARLTLGPQALPSVALVLVFNALTLWTLVTISIEWARHGSLSLSGLGKTALGVLKNPLIIGILSGTAFAFTGLGLPRGVDAALDVVGHAAGPLALLVLGMGISEYGIADGLGVSAAICLLKLIVQPLVVWGLAVAIGLPSIERQAVVLLASMSVGANVYLVSTQFNVLEGPVASSLVLSTLLAALTTPIMLASISGG